MRIGSDKDHAIADRNNNNRAPQSGNGKVQIGTTTDLETKMSNRYIAAVLSLISSQNYGDGSGGIDVLDSTLRLHCSQDFSQLTYAQKKSRVIPELTSLGYFVTEYDSEEFPVGETPFTVYSVIPVEWEEEYLGGGAFQPYTRTIDGWLRRQCGAGAYFKNHSPVPFCTHFIGASCLAPGRPLFCKHKSVISNKK